VNGIRLFVFLKQAIAYVSLSMQNAGFLPSQNCKYHNQQDYDDRI